MEGYWKIIDFAKQIGKHYNTVDNWFKALEERKIHYINRDLGSNEKVYDQLDLKIGLYISQKRSEKWSLEGIFQTLGDHFELRPFPITENESQVMDVESLKKELKKEWEAAFQESVVALERKLIRDPQTERQQRMDNMMLDFKVKTKLENEALGVWSKKPEEERMKKTGWFRKEEDRDKRDDFVKKYIQDNFESRIKEELDLESGS